ncbi:MAG: hypothetical protein ACPGO3_15695 [Magnetospiraceae bacterium]
MTATIEAFPIPEDARLPWQRVRVGDRVRLETGEVGTATHVDIGSHGFPQMIRVNTGGAVVALRRADKVIEIIHYVE